MGTSDFGNALPVLIHQWFDHHQALNTVRVPAHRTATIMTVEKEHICTQYFREENIALYKRVVCFE